MQATNFASITWAPWLVTSAVAFACDPSEPLETNLCDGKLVKRVVVRWAWRRLAEWYAALHHVAAL